MSTIPAKNSEEITSQVPGPTWLDGFLLFGLLTGLLGPLIIAWGYHLEGDPVVIGLHFLGFNAGYVLAVGVCELLLSSFALHVIALLGSVAGFFSLLALSFLGPPVSFVWRVSALALTGFAAGAVITAQSRVFTLKRLRFLPQRLLLPACTLLAMLGYALLSIAASLQVACVSVLVIASGFGSILPSLTETLDERFSYQPAFYNRTLAVGVTGAMCTAWLLGCMAAYFGIGSLLLLPALGSMAVLILSVLLMFESHLMRGSPLRGSPGLL